MRTGTNSGFGRLRPLALGSVLVVFAACGGGAAATSAPHETSAPANPVVAVDENLGVSVGPAASPVVTTIDVGKEAWFAGFHVTLGTATLETKNGRGTVKIETTLENTGEDGARLDATIRLASGGETATEGFDNDVPSVDGLASGKGLLSFRVKDTFTFDDAVLTLGLPTNQQAVLPLKGGADTTIALEPLALTLSGSGKADTLKLDVTGGEIRADQPWSHGQMKKGTLVLTVRYSATFDSGFAGGFAFTGENVGLKLPDGTTVGVIQDGLSQSVELLAPHGTKKDLLSRFEVSDPSEGTYVLIVRNGDATGEIPFTLD